MKEQKQPRKANMQPNQFEVFLGSLYDASSDVNCCQF